MQRILWVTLLALVSVWLYTNPSPGEANVLYGIEGYGAHNVACNPPAYIRSEWYRTDGVSVYGNPSPVGGLTELDYSYRGANFSGSCGDLAPICIVVYDSNGATHNDTGYSEASSHLFSSLDIYRPGRINIWMGAQVHTGPGGSCGGDPSAYTYGDAIGSWHDTLEILSDTLPFGTVVNMQIALRVRSTHGDTRRNLNNFINAWFASPSFQAGGLAIPAYDSRSYEPVTTTSLKRGNLP